MLRKEGKNLEQSKEVYKKEYRKITVKTTDGDTLKGKVNIGIKTRVADLFTKTDEPFIVLSDVEHKEGSKKVLFVNKNNIMWVEPQEE
jgi:small nuclear ribonucleoprotein (snRNP)-like protein